MKQKISDYEINGNDNSKKYSNSQTAVEWLVEKLKSQGLLIGEIDNLVTVKLAKQMDKKQKKECWNTAHQAGRFEGKGIAEENWQTFEQYYNETFKSK